MHAIQTVLIMALLGYLAFIFVAGSFNPFKFPKAAHNRGRYRVGLLIGGLLAASSITAWVQPSNTLISSISSSLNLSILLIGAVVICLCIATLYRWIEVRRRDRSEREHQLAAPTETALPDARHATSSANLFADTTLPSSDDAAGTLVPVSDTQDVTVTPAAVNDLSAHQEENTLNVINAESSHETIDTALPVSTDAFESPSSFDRTANKKQEGSRSGHLIELNAANQSRFAETTVRHSEDSNSSTSVIADDLFEKLSTSVDQSNESTNHNSHTESANVILFSKGANPIDEDVEWPDLTDQEGVENASDLKHLQAAMKTMTVRTEKVQDSVHRVVALSSKESYFRTRLEVERANQSNAQQKQMVLYKTELNRHRKDLESEVLMRTDLQTSADQRMQELKQAQARVRELEVTLEERQRVFADQMDSLEKTRSMARDAAQLARRAAVAQQKARTRALQERAARERLEISAKKAVDIARNAINKLAEEERRQRS